MSQEADHMLTQLYRDAIKMSSNEVDALQQTLELSGSIDPALPDHCSTYDAPLGDYPAEGTSPPLIEYPMQVEVIVKQEPDPLIEESYNTDGIETNMESDPLMEESGIGDDIQIQDTINNESDYTKKHMPSSVRPNHEAQANEDKYTCEKCKKKFSFEKNLKAHIKLHIIERLRKPKGEHMKPHLCTECNASFAQLTDLRQHMRCHSGENTFMCKICKHTVSDADLLKTHMKIHTSEKPYKCDVCEKSLSDKYNFNRHMRLHSGEKPYACNLCDYRSTYSNCLKTHIASHTGESLYHCIDCNVSFTRPDNLRRHIMKYHTGEFACELCAKKFSDSVKLKNHLQTHKLNKSFDCTECNSSFTQHHNLRRHMRSHSKEEPYVCDKCDYKSAHPHRLKLHSMRRHKVTEESVKLC